MAVWTGRQDGKNQVEVFTAPDFPGYEIRHQRGSVNYLIVGPGGPFTTATKFAHAESRVIEHEALSRDGNDPVTGYAYND